VSSEHPLALGLVARNGPYQAQPCDRQADVLLALGVRFDDRTSSSWLPGYSFTIPPTKLIHVDIDPEEIGRNYPVALGLMADVRTFLRQVLAELETRRNLDAVAQSNKKWLAEIDTYRRNGTPISRPASPMTAPDPPAARRCRHRSSAAQGCHRGQRYRVPPQLAHRILQADASRLPDRIHGLWTDGVRGRRRSRAKVAAPIGPASRCAAMARS